MASFSFDIQVTGLLNNLRKLTPRVAKAMQGELRDVSRSFQKHIIKNRLRGGPSSGKLGVRTGQLRRSFGVKMEGRGLESVGFIGFGPPASPWVGGAERYAAVHEGLVKQPIRPKRRKFLAIPVADNLTGAGVARVSSPLGLADPDFVPHIFSSGLGYLVFQDDRLMFLLLRSVRIPARLNFRNDWQLLKGGYVKRLFDAMDKAMR